MSLARLQYYEMATPPPQINVWDLKQINLRLRVLNVPLSLIHSNTSTHNPLDFKCLRAKCNYKNMTLPDELLNLPCLSFIDGRLKGRVKSATLQFFTSSKMQKSLALTV